jgi:SAM-dependent methyltransferase
LSSKEDGSVNLADFELLLTAAGQELLDRLAGGYEESAALSLSEKLRAEYPAGLVATALTQSRLRARAVQKFGARAARMYFTGPGYEQATRSAVAELRADRYKQADVRRVADLCCGIGGDALAFAEAGIEVLAVDRDPVTCAVLGENARVFGVADRVEVRCADAESVGLDGCDGVFLDPARRGERGRTFDPEAYSPPWSFAVGLAGGVVGGLAERVGGRLRAVGFKVAPGLPHELIPAGAQAEWVSDRGEVKEAGIYFGDVVMGASRQATLLPGVHRLESDGVPDPVPGEVGRYLYEPDGAVIRAHLLGELAEVMGGGSGGGGVRTIDPTIAYLTSDVGVDIPFVSGYEVSDVLPFNVKRLRAVVAERGYGSLTVKKRGADVDPALLRKQLRPVGANSAVLIVTRVGGAHVAIFAQEWGK